MKVAARRTGSPERGGRAGRIRSWTGAYAAIPGRFDAVLRGSGRPSPAWALYLDKLAERTEADLSRRFASAERHIRDTGVSYRVYGDAAERSWPLGRLPLVIDGPQWAELAAGIAQRATLLEAVLGDVYGPQRLVRDGTLPAALVAGSPEFLHPVCGVPPPGGRFLQLYAADLTQGSDGRWRVLADRTQAPSGLGYALENRLVQARAFPDLFSQLNVERLAPFFQAFRAGLAATASRHEPRICLLSSGPLSETYVEQAYLARYLGFLLVEGDDLIVRDEKLHVRTVSGLKRADVVWRRIDSDFVDPLELNPRSRLGVPGLLDTLRRGTLAMGNMPGSGLVEAAAFAAYLPALSRALLGEELRLPSIPTWWCGDPSDRDHVLARLGEIVVQPAFAIGHRQEPRGAAAAGLDALSQAIADRPVDLVGRERVPLSTSAAWRGGGWEPRPLVLRVFAAATADGWTVMPGGFCRMSERSDVEPISMGPGVTSADVWVLSDGPVERATLLPRDADVRVRRIAGHLPSRAADNLFWFGRYLERAEAVTRIVRCRLDRTDLSAAGDARTTARLDGLLLRWGSIEEAGRPASVSAFEALSDADRYGSALSHVRSAQRTASSLRDRLSGEAWRSLTLLGESLDAPEPSASEAELLDRAEQALGFMAALSGLAGENMNRAAGWHFLELGRRTERALNTCALVRAVATRDAGPGELAALLDLVDSEITYGSRYILGVTAAPVRDMVLLDPYNPRSVAFQIDRIGEHLAGLPVLRSDGLMETQIRLAHRLCCEIRTAEVSEFDNERVLTLERQLGTLADEIAGRYFAAGGEAARAEKLTGLA